MKVENYIGLRMRRERQARELTQKQVAEIMQISPTYLNLIEGGKRRVPDDILRKFCELTGLNLQDMIENSASKLATNLSSRIEFSQIDEVDIESLLVGQPEWRNVLVELVAQKDRLEKEIAELRDRLNRDERFSARLHDLLSRATSIRSTANILNTQGGLSQEIDGQFRQILDNESEAISRELRSLVSYFEAQSAENSEQNIGKEKLFLTAWELGYYFENIENNTKIAFEDWCEEFNISKGIEERRLFDMIERDAKRLPLQQVFEVGEEEEWQLIAMAQSLGTTLDRLLRRIAALSRVEGWGRLGMHIFDHTGYAWLDTPDHPEQLINSIECPIWPIYTAPSKLGDVASGRYLIEHQEVWAIAATSPWEQLAVGYPEQKTTMLSMSPDYTGPWANFGGKLQHIAGNCASCQNGDCQYVRNNA